MFAIEANRFLHHMVRFLVGTMLDVGSGKREPEVVGELLTQDDNSQVSPPAPPHALFLEAVEYPNGQSSRMGWLQQRGLHKVPMSVSATGPRTIEIGS